MRSIPLLLLVLLAACGNDPTLVVVNRLAPGNGGAATQSGPHFDIVIRMESDATGFNPEDLMRVLVDGVNRTDEVVIGGLYALLRLDPPPIGQRFVELFARTGPVLDTFTWTVAAFAGTTITGVAPQSARTGTEVTISGTGFLGGVVRVFFGGIEGTVDAGATTDGSITATVPAGALPGLVFVLIGEDAAQGTVEFQPLDDMDVPVPPPAGVHIFALLPGNGAPETLVEIYGVNFDNFAIPTFNGRRASRVFGIELLDFPLIGVVTRAFAVVHTDTPPGATAGLTQGNTDSNELPFTVN